MEHFDGSSAASVPAWRARWTPNSVYITYLGDVTTREYYGPDDPWQLENLFGDGLAENDPLGYKRWDRWLSEAATCRGTRCP